MKNSPDARRKVNREIHKRGFNNQAKKVIEQHTPQEEQEDLQVNFHCECSAPNCTAQVAMTLQQYEALHKDDAAFVIAKGHETPSVEEIAKDEDDLLVVKKFALK